MVHKHNIVIVGAGGMAQEVMALLKPLEQQGEIGIQGIIDDTISPRACFHVDYPYPVLGGIADYQPVSGTELILAIGEPQSRLKIAQNLRTKGAKFYNYIHPNAVIAHNAQIGEGIIIYPFSLISANTKLEDFVVINCHSGAGHDVHVGEASVICAHVDLTGHVKIGKAVLVGSHASVLPHVQVGDYAKVGAGSIVVRNVKENVTVFTPPARSLS